MGGLAQNWRLIVCVFLPFVAAYYLSFLFRTINATVAGALTAEFGLSAGDLGLLTSVYYLTFAAAQIPIGILLDRYGPGQIQSAVMVAAALGAALFAVSDNFWLLLGGRALIGLGVAASLTAGLKALVLWFPRERVPLLNGLMIMFGALGALTATLPAEFLLVSVGWRALFELLAIASAGLRRPTLLAPGPTFGDLHRDFLGVAGTMGGDMAQRCRGPRPAGIAAAFACHGNRSEFGRASVGRRG
jgi:MFS family permease